MYMCWKCFKIQTYEELVRATGKGVPKTTNWKMCSNPKCKCKTFIKV